MWRNYIIIAYRSLQRQLAFSLINITGLALGLTSSLVIILFVYRELNHDRHFKEGDRIYRIATSFLNLGTFANGPVHLNEMLLQYPGVESTARISLYNEYLIESETTQFKEDNVYAVDSTFFKLFNYSFVSGDPLTCLKLNSIVLTEDIARKYFGTTEAIGETLLVGKEKRPVQVTAIVASNNYPSHFKGEIWMLYPVSNPEAHVWFSAAVYNYIKIRPQLTQADLEEYIKQLTKNEVYPIQGAGKTYEEWVVTPNAYKLHVQPLHDIYLNSNYKFELSDGGNKTNLYVIVLVAGLILFLAMVNFVNLSTAKAGSRSKEIGLRKTLGTVRFQLITQFLTESVVTCLIALLFSLVLAEFFLAIYYQVIGQELLPGMFTNVYVLGWAIGFTVIIGILAGLYPAFYLTSFQPVRALKGNFKIGQRSGILNRLVVFQLTISACLAIFMVTIISQLDYIQSKDTGFEHEQVFVIHNARQLDRNLAAFQNQLSQLTQVSSSCQFTNTPAGNSFYVSTFKTVSMQDKVTYNIMIGDEHLLNTFGIALLEGRNFNSNTDTDSTAVIVNESAVKDLILDDPIGAEVNSGQKIVGVVRDFHFKGLQQKIEPLVTKYRQPGVESSHRVTLEIAFKVNGNIREFIQKVESTWKEFSPDEPVAYSFVDDNFYRSLEKERMFGKIIFFFAVLAIVISCMGLFGLSLFATEQRVKEIGIRKVMGASVHSLLLLLNRKFGWLAAIALGIAIPLSLYAGGVWLNNFAYHIPIGWKIPVIASLVLVVLVGVTVSMNAWKAAQRNPVETLNYE
jgi:putative ABC transport system permease protein